MPRTPEEIAAGFDAAEQTSVSAKCLFRLGTGAYVPPSEMPTKFYHSARRRHFDAKMPAAFGTPYLLFQPSAIALMQQFDLGNAYFLPVQLYQNDRETPINMDVATICIGNTKETVRQDMTERLKITRREGVKRLPVMPDDDVIVTRADAVSGVDLWCDPKIVNAWFMSDRLAQALIAAGLKDAFDLVRTKTVEGVPSLSEEVSASPRHNPIAELFRRLTRSSSNASRRLRR
nr:hypothetical protein [uncultured Celeribacter sp.]